MTDAETVQAAFAELAELAAKSARRAWMVAWVAVACASLSVVASVYSMVRCTA